MLLKVGIHCAWNDQTELVKLMGESMEVRSPERLIQALSVNHFVIPDRFKTLTEWVTETSRECRCPMSSEFTASGRRHATYRCRFGGREYGASAKLQCPMFVKFRREPDGAISIDQANWMHNHPVAVEFFSSHFNVATTEEVEQMQLQQILRVPPGQIRTNVSVTGNKDIFYNLRRNAIRSSKSETLSTFKDACSNAAYDVFIELSRTETLSSATFIHLNVVASAYAMETIVIDDTSGTNIYDLPLEAAITVDCEGRSQLLAFALLEDRRSVSYQSFFERIKEATCSEPRIVLTDRSAAQIAAVRLVFPTAAIVFCRVHLRRDLLKHFTPQDDIIRGYDEIHRKPDRCSEYVQLLESRLAQMGNRNEAKGLLENMLSSTDSWLPSRLIEIGCFVDASTNRVEGFFGNYKQHHGYTRVSAGELCKGIMNYGQLLFSDSLRDRSRCNRQYESFPLFEEGDIVQVGKLALDLLSSELSAWTNGEDNSPWCLWCKLREHHPCLALPCRHVMTDINKITPGDLHPRYLRRGMDVSAEHHDLQVTEGREQRPASYTDIMASLAPFASQAPRDDRVMQIFDETLGRLRSLGTVPNPGMPPTLAMQGRLAEHPSHHVVLGGAPKQINTYRCSVCGQPGHNARRHATS